MCLKEAADFGVKSPREVGTDRSGCWLKLVSVQRRKCKGFLTDGMDSCYVGDSSLDKMALWPRNQKSRMCRVKGRSPFNQD